MTENRDIAFSRLVDLLDTLRGPQGCPWDKEQTHESLKRYLLEESHEVFEVIDHNPEKLPEELGDVLLQVLFHAQIASEEGRFTIDDVLESLRDKLVRRHPHVFGEQKVRDAREVEANWEELKRGERTGQPDVSLLGSVPPAMPALAHSQLVQERAARSGFDWKQIDGVLDKVAEAKGEAEMKVAELQKKLGKEKVLKKEAIAIAKDKKGGRDGDDDGVFRRRDNFENEEGWLAYIIGVIFGIAAAVTINSDESGPQAATTRTATIS